MTIGRNAISDLEAIAAMPGLEDMAECIAPYCTGNTDPVSMLVYLAGQWPFGSRNELTSLFKCTDVWESMRKSAARVGRVLPKHFPTHDQLRHMRDQAGVGIGADLALVMAPAMKPLTLQVRLCQPTNPGNLASPNRSNTLYGDGTVFTSLTDNWFDERTGEFHGNTRSKDGLNPRWAETFYGKKLKEDKPGSSGLPIALMGAHGDLRWQRVVTGVAMYFDRNETGASMRLFHQAADIYGTGLQAFAYDRLLPGKDIREVMRRGVMPLVEMKGASLAEPHVVVPEHLRHKLGIKSQPKSHAIARALETITHPVAGDACAHHIWALDGLLRSCPPDEHRPNFDSDILHQNELRFEDDPDGSMNLIGAYKVPCPHGDVDFEFDHSGQRIGSKKHTYAIADWVRPIHIPLQAAHLRGFRVDVESTFRTAKGASSLFGRACSLEPDFFLLDFVGCALWMNATAWDVHASQHTVCGQKCAEFVARKANRKADC